MKKHIIDTDLYIEVIRTGKFFSHIDTLYEFETPGIYFSSIVAVELLVDAKSTSMLRIVQDLMRPFERVGRIIWPGHYQWKKAATVLGSLLKRNPSLKVKIPKLLNDCLIAVSARSIGAMVHTSNASDFRLIQSFLPYDLVVYPDTD